MKVFWNASLSVILEPFSSLRDKSSVTSQVVTKLSGRDVAIQIHTCFAVDSTRSAVDSARFAVDSTSAVAAEHA